MPHVHHHLGKNILAGGSSIATAARVLPCENGATRSKTEIAHLRGNGVTL